LCVFRAPLPLKCLPSAVPCSGAETVLTCQKTLAWRANGNAKSGAQHGLAGAPASTPLKYSFPPTHRSAIDGDGKVVPSSCGDHHDVISCADQWQWAFACRCTTANTLRYAGWCQHTHRHCLPRCGSMYLIVCLSMAGVGDKRYSQRFQL
jgi:hypothetical protein